MGSGWKEDDRHLTRHGLVGKFVSGVLNHLLNIPLHWPLSRLVMYFDWELLPRPPNPDSKHRIRSLPKQKSSFSAAAGAG